MGSNCKNNKNNNNSRLPEGSPKRKSSIDDSLGWAVGETHNFYVLGKKKNDVSIFLEHTEGCGSLSHSGFAS